MRFALAFVVLAVALVIAGCGGSPGVTSGENLAAGKALFLEGNPEFVPQSCAACHVLESAGAQGTLGPNLDDAFGPARSEGFELSTFEQVVREQMEIPGTPTPVAQNNIDGESRFAMPSRDDYHFTDAQANDIAFYVATCAGLLYLNQTDDNPEAAEEAAAARALCEAVPAPSG